MLFKRIPILTLAAAILLAGQLAASGNKPLSRPPTVQKSQKAWKKQVRKNRKLQSKRNHQGHGQARSGPAI